MVQTILYDGCKFEWKDEMKKGWSNEVDGRMMLNGYAALSFGSFAIFA